MKTFIQVITLIAVSFFTQNFSATAQISVTSTDGYTVNIVITPKSIIASSGSCQYGYNYNVQLDYAITYTGPNQPSSLYTMQGTLGCGSSSHFFDLPNGQANGTVISQSNVWNGASTCNSATVNNLSCNLATIEIEGPGISHRFVTFSANTNATLPVRLTSFSAFAFSNKVKVKWATANEINSSSFSVEKSVNGTSWSTVKTVAAAGNSAEVRNYEMIDDNPGTGTIQYRLKQVDIDGKAEYSAISVVKLTEAGSVVSVFPVPNTGNKISFTGIDASANLLLSVHTLSGVTVYSTRLANSNTELPSLSSGNYIIRLLNKTTGETTNLRYMKM